MQRTPTGIPGLDDITKGGTPRGRVTLVTGDAGAGKTILAMQYLVAGATQFDEPGVFVSFEEHADEMVANMAGLGWTVAVWQDGADLAPGVVPIISAGVSPEAIQAGDFDISGLLAAVSSCVARRQAKRVVFDGLDVLLDLLDDPRQRRREIARLGEWTRSLGVTTILTAKQSEREAPDTEGYGFLKYIVSCVIALRKNPREGSIERTARVLKVRGSSHSSSEHPLSIRSSGLVIGDVRGVRMSYAAPREHISSGLPRLDVMLGGGYYRASSILITGAPGTAKSTLSATFLDAACTRGERGLLISFDEAFTQIQRNMASVNIHLQAHHDSGLLATAGFRPGRLSSEEHFHQVMELVDAQNPSVLVIDPISALDGIGGLAMDLAERVIDESKGRGITVLMTSLLEGASSASESTRVQISSIADTWIQLSFSVLNGERNRALTIIKSRGNAHSNQVRELVLSDQGLALADVYAQGGAILMGTARMEQEAADILEEQHWRAEVERADQEIDDSEGRLKAQLAQIQAELRGLERRRSVAVTGERARISSREEARKQLLLLRNADTLLYRAVDKP